ncbi:Ig-like domain-containing protein, partial [Bradyrhizobium diazoefficiens]|uniref:Ig-like domain-containing protein n=1 Tax=Bradyrhizobium diazoefficiens TaxID=1355477 RepID=UPI0030A1ED96
ALNPDGSYSLDAGNAAYQHLAQGATTDVVANYTVTDEHGATSNSTLTITLSGTNDAPVAVADTDSGLEDSTITGTVASNDSDVDDGAILSYSLDAAVTGLTLNPDGSYSLDAGNAAYQHLAQGATTDVVANYTVTDEHGATSN